MYDTRDAQSGRARRRWKVGQDGLEVKRNLALHEEHRLAGDEDALTSQFDAEDTAAGGELFGEHFGLSEFIGPKGR